MDVEAILARATVRRAVYVGPPLVIVFALVRGSSGAWASALGLGVVVVNFLASGLLLSAAARRSLGLYHAAALFGFILRLGLITAAMFLVSWLVDLDRLAFGVTAVVSYLVLLTWEAAAFAKGAHREVEWSS